MEDAGATPGKTMNLQHTAEAASSTRFSSSRQPDFGPGKTRHGGTLRTHCPHCNSLAKVRDSVRLTALVKELRYQCSDLECGHTFVATLSIERTIVPSAKPNPRIRLAMGQARPRTPVDPANDDHELPASSSPN
tara:strand:- start:1678 stop:2079 length:402 start_codon:yes stop_codon:yes gene_type:complete